MNRPLIKSRDIPISEFFTHLQLEYISYKIRELIYKREEDKKKFREISSKKKKKIEWIATKNCLPTIFNNEKSQERYSRMFFKEWGLPNFQYRDEYQLKTKGWWDRIYYFRYNIAIKIKKDGDVVFGNILRYEAKTDMVLVKCNSGEFETESVNVCRIFNEDFFKKIFE